MQKPQRPVESMTQSDSNRTGGRSKARRLAAVCDMFNGVWLLICLTFQSRH
jgi:hypothetical protein